MDKEQWGDIDFRTLSNLFTDAIDMSAVDKLSKKDLDWLCEVLGIKKDRKEDQNKIVE